MRRKAKRPSPGQEMRPPPSMGRTCPRLLGGNIRSGKQNILPRGTKPAMRSGKAGDAAACLGGRRTGIGKNDHPRGRKCAHPQAWAGDAACLGGMEQRQSGRRKGKHEKQRAQRRRPNTAQKAPGGRRVAGLHQAAGNGEHNEHPCKATGNIHP